MGLTKKFRKRDKREKQDALKAQALENYRKNLAKARKQTSSGWGHPEPKVFITPRKNKDKKT